MTGASEQGLVTVVIPTHNRAALLREAIASVLASKLILSPQLLIVVDDQSTDETPRVTEEFGVRYLQVRCGGPSPTRNAGLAEVATPYVAFLDDDDCWLPGAVQRQLEALEREPRAAFAYGRAQRTDMDLSPIGVPFPAEPLPAGDSFGLVYRTHLQIGSLLFRTEKLRAEGGFDPSLRYCEDWHLFVRLAAKHPALGVDSVSSLFRQRDPSAAEAATRAEVHRDYARAKRDLRARGIRVPPGLRFSAYRDWVGYESYFMCRDVPVFLEAGERRAATASLLRGLRLSPVHALVGHRQFWRGAAELITYRGNRHSGENLPRTPATPGG